MNDPLLRSAKLRRWHWERTAVVYVRQSTPQQVSEHQESTARQYALVDRAVELGWPKEQVLVIDDDLGKSGESAEGRLGFQRLLAEVALDHVGLILGLEMSRLARSCKDWHQLLELCARFRTLLADTDGVYDPTDYNDRLLLGLKGTLSEAELHILKERMYQGKLNKARRGELYGLAPIGYIKQSSGEWELDPDEQVQATVRLLFDEFDRQGTLHGLLRYLAHHGIQLPVRPHYGPQRGVLQWRPPCRATLSNLLHHPSYAGAYRYGHRPSDPRKKQPGRRQTGRLILPPEACHVLLRDRVPAYITWERFSANQQRLADNRARNESLGAPRQGAALLKGLLRCGHCGRRMLVRYSGVANRHVYSCTRGTSDYGEPLCQSLSGENLDRFVGEQLLAAVQPAALQASLAAVTEVERERHTLTQHWRLRLERLAFETTRAARQFQACEPENRLVARELERRWEALLLQQQQLEAEFARWQQAAPTRLTAEDQTALLALAHDLPAVWQAATTTPADRQRLARLLLEQIRVSVDKTSEHVAVELRWAGGLLQTYTLTRPVNRYDQHSQYPRLVARLRALCAERRSSAQIAEQLNSEGFQPPKRASRFSRGMIHRLTSELQITRRSPHGSTAGLRRNEYRPAGLARLLGVSRDVIRRWIRVGWVTTHLDSDGHHIIWADASERRRLQELRQTPRTWAHRARLSTLQRPKPRPTR